MNDAIDRVAEQLRREMKAHKEWALVRFQMVDEALALRLDMIRAIQPMVDRQIKTVFDILGEKVIANEHRLEDRDKRADIYEAATKEAQTAAFASAKELALVTSEQFKSEISALRTAAEVRAASVDERYQALKERIDRGEGADTGRATQRIDRRAVDTLLLAVVSTLFLGVSVVFAVYVATHR